MRNLVVGALVATCLLLTSPVIGGEIHPELAAVMDTQGAEKNVSALIYLAEQTDLDALEARFDGRPSLQQRHETVVRALQNTAATTQNGLVAELEALKATGLVDTYKTFWIANIISVTAQPEVIRNLAKRSDVARVYYNYEIELVKPMSGKVVVTPPRDDREPTSSLQAINAPDAWALGYDGTGILVANMDTGVDGNHPALASRWAGLLPEYAGHPEWAWFDPYAGQNDFPYDNHGHGTHTMGSVCGGPPGDEIGVAPGAVWMASAPIDRGGGIQGTVEDAIESFQWMADPDGNPATVWDVPLVCSNSWGVTTGHGYPPCDELFWEYLDACEAVGCVILFSAGNEGSSGLRRPSDRATDDYRTCAVGAVDAENHGYPWPIASFSSRGPTYCTPDGSAAIKPDISAPGVDVYSAYPGGTYTTLSGTSMASPHANGVVALIRQACPDLTVEEVKQVLYDTAVDLGPEGEDNDFGWGCVDALAAVQLALELCIDSEGRLDLDAEKYACEDDVLFIVRDIDLNLDPNVAETVDITVVSNTEPGGEVVTCVETGLDTSRFEATIAISETDGGGVLLVADGDTITATYIDADNGQGQQVTVTATAVVDCTPPVIQNVEVIDLQPRSAEIQLTTDEDTFAIAYWGPDCDNLNNEVFGGGGYSTNPTVNIGGLQDNTTYYYRVEAEDEAGNRGVDPECYSFTTPEVPDFFTEEFLNAFDLDGLMLTFEPAGGVDFYAGCTEEITELPTDPAGGTPLSLSDDDYATVNVAQPVLLYGTSYTTFYVGSNGYLTFNSGETDYTESLEDHFSQPRVSGYYDDLNPNSGGTISYLELADRVAITYEDVPEYSNTGSNTFQIELFYDGVIRISYLGMTGSDCVAGLSEGVGLDPDYYPSDLSHMGSCGPRPPSAIDSYVEVPVNTPTAIELPANDDGTPEPLTYIVTSLPSHGTLFDDDEEILSVPYETPSSMLTYDPDLDFYGDDTFTWKCDDGGSPPEGGESNEATVSILVLYGPPAIATEVLPDGCMGGSYSYWMEATGGQPELTWTLLPGSEYTEFDLEQSYFEEVGTAQGWQTDDGTWEYSLPFSFPFFGSTYDSVWVCSNGFIDFASSSSDYSNSDAELIENVRIAPLWDDLKTYSPHDIYIDAGADYVTFRWDAETYSGGYQVNMSTTLYADGRIQFHYGSGNTGLSPTIGISSGNGSDYLLSMYNNAGQLPDANSLEYRGIEPLPDGLTLDADGQLHGTPSQWGNYAPRVMVTDALGRSDEALMSLTVMEECPFVVGDMDCDGDVDFDDINPFVLALSGQAAYQAAYPDCNWLNGDVNEDGAVDFDDIGPFVVLLEN